MQVKVRRWIAVGVVSAVGWSAPAWAQGPRRTLVVDDDRQQCPNAQFTSIQAAVLAAQPGGHIRVCPGLYPESVTVDRRLTLDGAGPAPEFRSGNPQTEAVVQTTGRGFDVQANDTEISGFTVLGDGSTTLGIDVSPFATGCSVERNYVRGHVIGIELSVGGPNRRRSLISHNRAENCRFGIAIDDNLNPEPDVFDALLTIRQNALAQNNVGLQLLRMRGVTVRQNTITDFATGIQVLRSTEVDVQQNTLETGGFSDVGIALRNDFGGTSVVGNGISGRFRGPTTAGILLDTSTNDVVAGNRITRMDGDGILLSNATANTVMLNRTDDNGENGIALDASSENQLFLNRMHDNGAFDANDDNRDDNVWRAQQVRDRLPAGAGRLHLHGALISSQGPGLNSWTRESAPMPSLAGSAADKQRPGSRCRVPVVQ